MQKRPRFLTKKRKDGIYCNATVPSVHLEQRKAIQIGAAHRQKATEIAFALNVNPTSISRESKRNRIPDGDGTVECEKTQRFPFVCAGCPNKHARSLAYNPATALASGSPPPNAGFICDRSQKTWYLKKPALTVKLALKKLL